ncbi:FAD-dependent oxidoreductase [Paraliomyxa miuraensis]|uniref:FAD-dependent oxidoreductase n=1 Tax=Paraliomyxa miuraensis TaxID=376150 RepID=UPI00224D30F2|nr:FAD-dependent oxidoreductase [Paraliomyxa miuraensis]MCX4246656.1 FAD-dependent oxidoreductase [Paraliomyxa miuraensis]
MISALRAQGPRSSNDTLKNVLRLLHSRAGVGQAQSHERPWPSRWLPAAIHWGVTLAPLGVVGLATVAAPWMLIPISAIGSLYGLSLLEPWRARPTASGAPVRRRVAIIGAGPSGLVALKEFTAAGHDVVCFEATASVGGVFNQSYDGVLLTSSAAVTAFSDFPPAPGTHRHWTKGEYVDYLERYVDHFEIRSRIHLEHRVEQAHFDEARGGWLVTTRGTSGTDPTTHGPFDSLVVCSGLHQMPNLPQAHPTGFRGQVLHSKDYHNAAPFAGKRVVVVGLGETGADLVAEIASVAASVVLSLRRGAYVIPRINPRTGYPNDYDSNRLRYALPKWAHDLAVSTCDRAYARWGAARPSDRIRVDLLRRSGSPSPFRRFATKSDNFVDALERNRCRVGAGFVGFTENGVELANGEEVPADVVLFATGFRPAGYAFLDDETVPHCPSQLWRLMYSSKHRERLVFIGFVRPAIGAIPPIAEVQARYAALVASGQRQLPEPPQMVRESAERRRAQAASFDEPRPVTLVDWIPYMDDLADRIGCRPRLREVLLRPRLAWRLATGPMVAAQYRLTGPDSAPELAEQSLELPGGMRLRDKLWFLSIHALVAGSALWEALPARRRYRACALV